MWSNGSLLAVCDSPGGGGWCSMRWLPPTVPGLLRRSMAHSTRSVPLSSLYRSLAVLVKAEVLAQHHGADETTRYELAEWLTEHHHHLVCVSCGSITDVTASEDQEAGVGRLVVAFAGS